MVEPIDDKLGQAIRKQSVCLWKRRSFKLSALIMVILLLVIMVNSIVSRVAIIICRTNLKGIDNGLSVYMFDYKDKLPLADSWNDLLVEYTDVGPTAFQCPGSKSSDKMSDYAINANLYELESSGQWTRDTVVLFECDPGWNKTGGSELFNFTNHRNKGGCYNTASMAEGYFVLTENIGKLTWEPKQK